ncbi:MAG: DsbA family oxidoreductase [Burkholderiales bacterium]|nr:DsbA family oxidoreductase [Burkholderiales bacterium]
MHPLKIDFVSDISCPWCAVGLSSLELALGRLSSDVQADLHCQPFELNPHMPAGGQDITEHLSEKYGSTAEQQEQVRDMIRLRGAEVGFAFNTEGRGRIYNTFNAHRLLHWAGVAHPERQMPLKKALLQACHRDRQAMDAPEVLLAAVQQVGLDGARAQAILDSDEFAQDVRELESLYTSQGIHAVPAVIINDRYLISGGQPVDVYEQVLREIATEGDVQPR